ncbi:Indole-3-pyruvate decarboxylase [Polystyrenella longa]|uniref:Indole-3-pyruvate decarboxylase n=1 Tax=Polystyrenella longa TaxID=2528007 RepID=A0A518CQB4_9PLAN|nr:thiamine pyrophosphate-binding protein [Polystyrenella longa]QDU81426.1 Indole-3-pyruvate decarboxylase [Polystyrenella longa]
MASNSTSGKSTRSKKTVKNKATGVSRRSQHTQSSSTDRKQKLQENKLSVGEYLIQRLQDYGLKDLFGIPGDFILGFYGMLEESPIRVVGTTREDNAGYAADAYARINGLGAICVTYCVGGLSVTNSIAGAYAEKSPVIVITGAPGLKERASDPLLHHRVRDFSTQREVFEKITVASTSLEDPLTAFREIDRCLEAAVRYKRPVYIEIPRDQVDVVPDIPYQPHKSQVKSEPNALSEALKEAEELIKKASKPMIIAGVEVHRFGLHEQVVKLAEAHNIPICTTLLGKSAISEKHPLHIGVYEGAMGRAGVQEFVEESDLVIMIGTFMTDINLGIYTAHLDPGRCLYVTSEKLRMGYHHFHDVLLTDFINGLTKLKGSKKKRTIPAELKPKLKPYKLDADRKITVSRLFTRLNQQLADDTVVVADVGDSLFASADLTIYQHTEFLSPAYYTSMGFAIPAALGVQVANRELRPLVLVGDGAFQMTCNELATTLRYEFNPIVIVLNNKGYTTERFIQEGPFNDIPNWNYHRIPDLFGGGWGFEIHTEGDFEKALNASLGNEDAFSLLNVHLDPLDTSQALNRLAKRIGKGIVS